MNEPLDLNKKRPGPWDDETFELAEDVFARWDKENEKWYNKYFVIPFRSFIYAIMEFPSKVKWFYQRGSRGWSDRSAWSIDTWLVDNLIPMLERLEREQTWHTNQQCLERKMELSKNGIPTDEADLDWPNNGGIMY